MLKKKLKYYSFILLAAILVFGCGLYFDRLALDEDDYLRTLTVDVQAIEKVLHEKENRIDEIFLFLDKALKTKKYRELEPAQSADLASHSLFTEPELRDLKEEGIVLLLFRDEVFCYWSSNMVPVYEGFKQDFLTKPVLDLNNGFYVLRTATKGNITMIALILVKQKYPYENDYLPPKFHDDFNLASTVDISASESDGTNNIRSKDGKILFSLLPMLSSITAKPYYSLSVTLYFIAIFLLLIFFDLVLMTFKHHNVSFIWLIIAGLLIGLIRYAMEKYRIPYNFYHLLIYQTPLFAGASWYPNYAALIINALFIFSFIRNFYLPQNFQTKILQSTSQWWQEAKIYSLSTLLLITIVFLFFEIEKLITNFIVNSTIPFELYKLIELNVFSFVGLLVIALLFAGLFLLTDRFIGYCTTLISLKQFGSLLGVVLLGAIVLIIAGFIQIQYYSIVFLSIAVITIAIWKYKKLKYAFYSYIFLILIISIYSAVLLTVTNIKHEKTIRESLIFKYAIERDPLAEHLIAEAIPNIESDEMLSDIIEFATQGGKTLNDAVYQYLKKTHFGRDWKNYKLEVTVCGESDLFGKSNNLNNCWGYYGPIFERVGTKLADSDYYFLDKRDGSTSYFGSHVYYSRRDSSEIILFVELRTKIAEEELGYPELLLDTKLDSQDKIIKEYSYAKYKKKQLLIKSGIFPYGISSETIDTRHEKRYFTKSEGFDHLIYNHDEDTMVVLSKPSVKLIDGIVSFSYLFLFFFMLFGITFVIGQISNFKKKMNFGFKNKILFSMLTVLLLSFLFVGGVTIYSNLQFFRTKIKQDIQDRIKSVMTALIQNYDEETNLTGRNHELEALLTKLSLIFSTDINLYSPDGNLLASSRPEVFNRGLTGTKMNAEAYRQLAVLKKARIIHDEQIGSLKYSSAYVPFYNNSNYLFGYINLPYFTGTGLLSRELTPLVSTIVNIYVVLLLLSITIAFVFSDKITYPLQLIQNKFRQMKLGKSTELISYSGKDEIGSLVKEYNRMVVELDRSIERLAQSERENAWREMAKQIAHEIKNPLTPMKLSIQFLLRAWAESDSDPAREKFRKRLDSVSRTLVEQIDTLSTIASEFSNFAKMPLPNNQIFDVTETLNQSVTLFANSQEAAITLELKEKEPVYIHADKEQLSRVFINLIKNGIQSVPEGKHGIITVGLHTNDRAVTIVVEDNGIGIADEVKDKLFRPNFTTKSSGTGLGLAIVKNIIENAKGTIWFETEIDKGSRFFVELPRIEGGTIQNYTSQ